MLSVLYLMPTCYVFKLWYISVYISVDSATVSLLCCINYLFHDYAVVPEWHNFWATSVKSSGTNIKTHGSVSCGPRSRRVTPVSILTVERKRNFRTSVALCCLDETRRFFLLWTLPLTSALHIPNLSEIASSVPEICDFKNSLSFFVFFLLIFLPLFAHLQKLL